MLTFRISWQDILLVIAGGPLGSLMRYMVSVLTHYHTSSPFPYKTLIINVLGCLLVGFLSARFQSHAHQDLLRLFFITGFLGAFTTFSAFSMETVMLYQSGHIRTALMNILASTVSGITAVIGGFWLGSKF